MRLPEEIRIRSAFLMEVCSGYLFCRQKPFQPAGWIGQADWNRMYACLVPLLPVIGHPLAPGSTVPDNSKDYVKRFLDSLVIKSDEVALLVAMGSNRNNFYYRQGAVTDLLCLATLCMKEALDKAGGLSDEHCNF